MLKIILVTLVHNRKNLVGPAIQSAVNQTLPKDKWMHLIIDNASDDGADKVCEVFSAKYSHIVFQRMPTNMHQMPAYNWALGWIKQNHPEAEIMAMLDSDDLLAANALAEVEKMFDAHPEIGQTYSDFNIIDGKGNLKIKAHPKAKQVDPKIELTDMGQKILRSWEIKYNVIGHMRSMRIKALQDIGGFDETYKYATDVNMACKMLSSKYKVMKIPKILYLWRQHDQQIEKQNSPQQTLDWENIQKKFLKLFKENGLI